MKRPSGDNDGSNSGQGDRVRRLSPVPSALMDQTSWKLSKTIRPESEVRSIGEPVSASVVGEGRNRDTGVPESVREQLFYPFYQVSERHPRLGTGLGLAIAKGFLVLMDGEIWIEDTPGGGATFAFSLPAGVTDEEGSDPRGR